MDGSVWVKIELDDHRFAQCFALALAKAVGRFSKSKKKNQTPIQRALIGLICESVLHRALHLNIDLLVSHNIAKSGDDNGQDVLSLAGKWMDVKGRLINAPCAGLVVEPRATLKRNSDHIFVLAQLDPNLKFVVFRGWCYQHEIVGKHEIDRPGLEDSFSLLMNNLHPMDDIFSGRV